MEAVECMNALESAKEYFVLVVALVSFLGIIVNYMSASKSSQYSFYAAENSLFLELRERYHEIRSRIEDECFLEKKIDTTAEVDAGIRDYWNNVFDEWYTTKVLHRKTFSRLWNDYYADAIRDTLEAPTMKQGLIDILKSKPSYGKRKKKEFFIAMTELYPELPSEIRALKSGFPEDILLAAERKLNRSCISYLIE